MNELFKKPATIIIIIAAILIALGWSFFERRAERKQAENDAKAVAEQIAAIGITNLSNVDPTEFDEVVKEEFASANSKALEADAKNQFSALVVELPGDIKVSSGNNRYVFSSESNSSANWTVTISQKTGNFIRAIIPKDDYLGQLTSIDTKLWKFNYVTALQIAEKSGGKEWRESNKPQSVTLTLANSSSMDRLIWGVEYATESDKLVIKIDSNSGKIAE